MISTPYTAYQWLRGLGLTHEASVGLTASRTKFEYFLAVLKAIT